VTSSCRISFDLVSGKFYFSEQLISGGITAEFILNDDPAKGRVLQSLYFVISDDDNCENWVQTYTAQNPQSRTPVVFSKNELENKAPHDNWLIRNTISRQLFARDMFDYQLPIDNDMFFFGREAVIASHIDKLKTCKNVGIFGLRKTGKTSVIYKMQRQFQRGRLGLFQYYDAKMPSIRSLRWYELLEVICDDISRHYQFKPLKSFTEKNASSKLADVLSRVSNGALTCLVFDEIEYISPMAILDDHWKEDFTPFWQTIWSIQSRHRSLVSVIAGVNPCVAEQDIFNNVQNPMFGIINSSFLKGLEVDDLRKMLGFFGKRMGMKFSESAIDFLFKRYGGHPLLTRLVCSDIHNTLAKEKIDRPYVFNANYFTDKANTIDENIQFYCRHVVSEIKQFYPDEYEMLELIATGNVLDFMELSLDPDLVRHLNSYGLIQSIDSRPEFAIPVVGKYIGSECARQAKSNFRKIIIEKDNRDNWISKRVNSIIKDMRLLEKIIENVNSTPIYGQKSFFEPEKFAVIGECESNDGFVSFINICNRTFVEPIDKFWSLNGGKKYFWDSMPNEYPNLWNALNRIRAYRNNDLHIELNANAEKHYKKYLEIDLEGRRVSQVEEPWFRLQQCVIDELLTGIICEINSRN